MHHKNREQEDQWKGGKWLSMRLQLLLSSRFFKFWTAWVQQGHIITGDVQDVVGVEEDGTNSSNPESP
jgi:hypothetical protein